MTRYRRHHMRDVEQVLALLSEPWQLCEVDDAARKLRNVTKERQPVLAHSSILAHHKDIVKKGSCGLHQRLRSLQYDKFGPSEGSRVVLKACSKSSEQLRQSPAVDTSCHDPQLSGCAWWRIRPMPLCTARALTCRKLWIPMAGCTALQVA